VRISRDRISCATAQINDDDDDDDDNNVTGKSMQQNSS
jgi:hypothetical protein